MDSKIKILKHALGLTPNYEQEVVLNKAFLLAQQEKVFQQVYAWLEENQGLEIKVNHQELFIKDFYSSFVSGEYQDVFYSLVYKQTLRWYHLGLTENQTLVLLSQMWQTLLAATNPLENFTLDKAICLLIDLVRVMSVNIFSLAKELEMLKEKSNYEAKRIDQAFSLLEANLPDNLVEAYLNHHQWKYIAISQILGKGHQDLPNLKPKDQCNLSQWLAAGGQMLIPASKWEEFDLAHGRVHQLADEIIHFAQTKQTEEIYSLLDELERASNLVSETLLGLIDASITELASFDPLTKLRNRTTLNSFIEQNISIAKRFNKKLGVILLDIDHFKRINDTYGHLHGDQVLIELAGALNEQIRPEDTLFRWGGEEFLIIGISDDNSENSMPQMAERMRRAIEVSEFCSNTANPVKLTSSFGVIEINYQDEIPMEEIFAQADKLLYQAKEAGRNQVFAVTVDATKKE